MPDDMSSDYQPPLDTKDVFELGRKLREIVVGYASMDCIAALMLLHLQIMLDHMMEKPADVPPLVMVGTAARYVTLSYASLLNIIAHHLPLVADPALAANEVTRTNNLMIMLGAAGQLRLDLSHAAGDMDAEAFSHSLAAQAVLGIVPNLEGMARGRQDLPMPTHANLSTALN